MNLRKAHRLRWIARGAAGLLATGFGATAAHAEEAPAAVPTAPAEEQPAASSRPVNTVETGTAPAAQKSPIEFHGYLRSGFGVNGEGGDQLEFFAPGAGVPGQARPSYRLGNEPETWGEIYLTNHWLDSKTATLRTVVGLGFETANNSPFDSDNDKFGLAEAFAEIGSFIDANPTTKVWVGKRFYQYSNITIIDFPYLDLSAYGGGVEDIAVPFGKLALAYLGGSTEEDQAEGVGRLTKNSLHARLHDVPLPLGKLTVWVTGSRINGGEMVTTRTDTQGNPVENRQMVPALAGFSAGVVHQTDIAGGNNKVVVQYGNGASSDFSAGYRRPGTSFSAVPGKRFVEGQWRFRLLDAVMFQPHEMFSLMGVALFQRTDHASVLAGGVVDWYSFGVRPTFHASEHVSFSLEGGVDYVDAPRGVPEHDIQEPISDHVTKVTFAPQLTGGNKILSRPALRAYVTYARWGDDYVGHVARAAYADDNQGLGAGVQLESEW